MNQMKVVINVTITNVSLYCTASKGTILQWCMTSADPPSIMFFCKKYLLAIAKYIMVIPTRLHCVQGKHLMRN